jgi:hypothetical protein
MHYYGIASAAFFPAAYLRMYGQGVIFVNHTGGEMNIQTYPGSYEALQVLENDDPTHSICSTAFPNECLSIGGTGINSFIYKVGGFANCAYGVGPVEKFRLEPQSDPRGSMAIASVKYKGVYLRMEAGNWPHNTAAGGGYGVVNCQWDARSYEKIFVPSYPHKQAT